MSEWAAAYGNLKDTLGDRAVTAWDEVNDDRSYAYKVAAEKRRKATAANKPTEAELDAADAKLR